MAAISQYFSGEKLNGTRYFEGTSQEARCSIDVHDAAIISTFSDIVLAVNVRSIPHYITTLATLQESPRQFNRQYVLRNAVGNPDQKYELPSPYRQA